MNSYILGDPGADSGDEGKSKRVEKCGPKKSKERRARRAPGDNVLPDQFQRSPPFWLLIGTRKLVFFWHQSILKKNHSFQPSNDLHTEKEYDMSP